MCDGALDVFAAGTACRQAGLAARGQSLSLSQSAPMLRELTLVTHQFVPQSIAFLARSPMLPQLHIPRPQSRCADDELDVPLPARCLVDQSARGEVVLVRHARRFANDARVAPRIRSSILRSREPMMNCTTGSSSDGRVCCSCIAMDLEPVGGEAELTDSVSRGQQSCVR